MKDPILLAGICVAFGCLFARRTPVAMLHIGCVYARAAWMLAGNMAEGAWARRERWEECKQAAWRGR